MMDAERVSWLLSGQAQEELNSLYAQRLNPYSREEITIPDDLQTVDYELEDLESRVLLPEALDNNNPDNYMSCYGVVAAYKEDDSTDHKTWRIYALGAKTSKVYYRDDENSTQWLLDESMDADTLLEQLPKVAQGGEAA